MENQEKTKKKKPFFITVRKLRGKGKARESKMFSVARCVKPFLFVPLFQSVQPGAEGGGPSPSPLAYLCVEGVQGFLGIDGPGFTSPVKRGHRRRLPSLLPVTYSLGLYAVGPYGAVFHTGPFPRRRFPG
jgi:hypothetical protein